MKTAVTSQAHGGVEVKRQKRLFVRLVFAWFVWMYDRFVFWVIYRGRRLRPEVGEELLQDLEEVQSGRDTSPGFSNTEDAVKWLKSQG